MSYLGEKVSLATWHACLGNNIEKKTRELVNKFELPVSLRNMQKCKACILEKMHQQTYESKNNNINSVLPLDLLFADVWGWHLWPQKLIQDLFSHYGQCYPI